jgi:nucleotide-binding universal stress UspA family protein
MKNLLTLAWSPDDPSAFDVAASIARDYGAHVTGLALPSIYAVNVVWAEVGMGAPLHGSLAGEEETERMDALSAAFFARMEAGGVPRVAAPGEGAGASWMTPASAQPPAVGQLGRVADLLVVPRPGGEAMMPESVFEDALFDSGRPVLLVPPGAKGPVGRRIAIAWNGSTETARAVAMSMGLLKRAEAVEVLSVDGAIVPGPSAADLAAALRRHGLAATATHHSNGGAAPGQVTADKAAAWGADLIIKGAYTQSRLRQLIFGGVTRHLILASPVPVLFAH